MAAKVLVALAGLVIVRTAALLPASLGGALVLAAGIGLSVWLLRDRPGAGAAQVTQPVLAEAEP